MRFLENLPTDRVPENVIVQALPEICAGRQLENPAVINESGAHIAALERNNPAPPAVTHEVIRRPRAARAARVGESRVAFAKLIRIPILHPGETRPHRVNRMIGIRAVMAELARHHGGTSTRIDHPARANRARFFALRYRQHLPLRSIQFDRGHFAGRRIHSRRGWRRANIPVSRVERST